MNDVYLDIILWEIKNSEDTWTVNRLKHLRYLPATPLMDSLNYLKQLNYLTLKPFDDGTETFVSITNFGKRFILNGGFTAETKLKNSPLTSIKLSKWAIGISILAIVVSVIAIYLQIKNK